MNPESRYLTHIDGLRAIAVVAVVLFHYKISGFSAGFLGVDIFFVISGFLITKNILEDIESDQWTFKKFYLRRARRIFPALFSTIAISFLLFAGLLAPSDFAAFAKSVIAAIFSFANVLFWKEAGYFDRAADFKPLLHTWSLGVEEQIYLFWPVILLVAYKIKNRLTTFMLLALIFSSSLIGAEYFIKTNPAMAFFLVPFRLFEFMIGAGLVWVMKKWRGSQCLSELIALSGVALLSLSFLIFNEKSNLPGLFSLVVCAGTALIILTGENTRLVGTLLKLKWVTGLGLISYSLYLIHWPVWVFYSYHQNRPWNNPIALPEKLLIFAVSIALSIFSYLYVEQIFRKNKEFQTKKWLQIAGIYAIVMTVLSITVVKSEGWKWRLSNEVLAMYQTGKDTYGGRSCKGDDFPADCLFGDLSSKKTVYVVGDSHGKQYVYGLDKLFKKLKLRAQGYFDGCLFLKDSNRLDKGKKTGICTDYAQAKLTEIIQSNAPVIIAQRWGNYPEMLGDMSGNPLIFESEQSYVDYLDKHIQKTLELLSINGRPVFLFEAPPEVEIITEACIFRPQIFAGNVEASSCLFSRADLVFEKTKNFDRLFENYRQGSFANVNILDPKNVLCDSARCKIYDDRKSLYRDGNHLTEAGSEKVISYFEEPLMKSLATYKFFVP